jgi:hypothetical protein
MLPVPPGVDPPGVSPGITAPPGGIQPPEPSGTIPCSSQVRANIKPTSIKMNNNDLSKLLGVFIPSHVNFLIP